MTDIYSYRHRITSYINNLHPQHHKDLYGVVEQIIISRRLSSIAAHFPHRDSDTIAGLPEMYSDLLELSRYELLLEGSQLEIRAFPGSICIRLLHGF